MDDDQEQQEQEFCAVEAIFEEDCHVDRDSKTCEVFIPSRSSKPCIKLVLHFPQHYPSQLPPIVEMSAPHLSDDVICSSVEALAHRFQPGEVVLFDWVEWVKEQTHLWEGTQHACRSTESAQPQMDEAGAESDLAEYFQLESDEHKAGIESEDVGEDVGCPEIVSGEPFTERKSTFQAHVATISSTQQVDAVVNKLLKNNKIRNATHNIMAYRIHVSEKGTFLQDYDDDGEAAAGGRLLHLLQVADARNVVVVVSRWFGGILLGPARFGLINNTARALLESLGHIQGPKQTGKPKRK